MNSTCLALKCSFLSNVLYKEMAPVLVVETI